MSTSGGGWTYLMNPNIIGLNTYSLGMSSLLNYGGGTECLDVNIEKNDANWHYIKVYICGSSNRYIQTTSSWINTLGATQVLFRGTSGGNSNYININGGSGINYSNSKNSFALTSGSCGTNTCWDSEAFRNDSQPTIKSFLGDLSITTQGYSDANSWGGSSSIWGVAVR